MNALQKTALISAGVGAAALAGTAMSPIRADGLNSEIQEVADEIRGLITDFQAANDDRIKQLESRNDTVVKAEEVERINAAITAANDNMKTLQAQVTALETMAARANVGGGDQAEREERQFAARFFSQVSGKYRNAVEADLDMDQYRNYRDAFPAYLRGQGNIEHLGPEVRNSMQVGSDAAGGYWVPAEMDSRMVTKLWETSEMRQYAGQISIGSDMWEQPKDVNDATSGGWVSEMAARAATDTPEIGMQRIETFEQYAYPEITQKMIDDAMIDIAAWLENKTVGKMERTENTAFCTGTGVGQPRGFLSYADAAVTTKDETRDWGVLQRVNSGAAGAFPTVSGSSADDASKLIDMVSKLKKAYRPGAVWAMNSTTEATVRKLRDGDGRYLVDFGNLETGIGFSLHGHAIANFEDMADIAANSYSIAFGNFGVGYLIVDRAGFRVLRDPFTNKPYVGLYVTKRVGGDVVNFDAIKLMKFAA